MNITRWLFASRGVNITRWLLASVGVYIAYEILNLIIHSVILKSIYEETKAVWRPEPDMKMWIMWITAAIFSLLFVYIFTKGYEGKGIMEGVRYGLWIGLFVSIPMAYNSYATLAIPYKLAFQWWVYGTIQCIICGIVASWLYKPAAHAETSQPSQPAQPA